MVELGQPLRPLRASAPIASCACALLVLALLLPACAVSRKEQGLAASGRRLGAKSLVIKAAPAGGSVAEIGMKNNPQQGQGDSSNLLKICYDIAQDQGTSYFVLLNQTAGRKGITTVGFTNQPKPKIPAEFGEAFTQNDRSGKPRTVFSVAEIAKTIPPPSS